MKSHLPLEHAHRLPRFLKAALLLTTLLASTIVSFADPPETRLTIRSTGTDFEGQATFQLEWNAVSNATYRVQRAASLAAGQPWETVDVVTPTGVTGQIEIKGRSIPENSVEFFRLLLPQAEIFSVEPAVFAPGVAVDLYVLGQCFQTNDGLRIDGVDQTTAVIVSPSVIRRPAYTTFSVGTHTVQLVRAGLVLSSFDVICADVTTAPELVLQEPPTMPPAAPARSKQSEVKSNVKKAYTSERSAPGRTHSVGEGRDYESDGLSSIIGFNLQGRDNDQIARLLSEPAKPRDVMADVLRRTAHGGTHEEDKDCGEGEVFLSKGTQGSKVGGSSTSESNERTGGDCDDHDPAVHPWSGEVSLQTVDLAVEGNGLDFIWARNYRSRLAPAAQPRAGARWTHSYDVRWAPNGSGGIDVYDGSGRKDTFKLQTNGTYACAQFFREGTLTGGVFRITFADSGYWEFNPFDASSQFTSLARIVDRSGNTVSLNYDSSGLLTQIVDDLGRTNTVSYDSDGFVKQVTDFSGRVVKYAYYKGGETGGSPGDLKSVTSPPVTGTPNGNDFPAGKTTTYTYSTGYADDRENHLLLSVISPQGQEVYKHIYQHNQTDLEFLRCISVQRWTNTPTAISYLSQTATPANQFATMRCIINDPEGDVVECFYDARNRCVKVQEFTGRSTPGVPVSDTSNRPTKPLRLDDPPVYESRWSWNNDSLCTLEVAPGGQQVRNVYQSDFDQGTPARKRADLRVAREVACCDGGDLDGDGLADITERAWQFEYDPRFGSDPTQRHHPTTADPYPDPKNCCGMACPAIKTKGTGTSGKIVPTVSNHAINTKGTGTAGRIVPTVSNHAINTKGTGSAGRLLPTVSKHAINTKGTGYTGIADDLPNDHVIKYKGTGDPVYDKMKNSYGRAAGGGGGSIPRGPNGQGLRCSPGSPPTCSSPQCADSFITGVIDPRGNVTTGNYDTNGNLLHCAKYLKKDGAFTAADFDYKAKSRLASITNAPDGNGYRRIDTFDYYTNGLQNGYLREWTIDATGPEVIRTSFEYDARGNLTRCVDANSNDWLSTYNALDQCVQIQTPLLSNGGSSWRITTQFAYDANDNLTVVDHDNRDENGVPGTTPTLRTQFVYDALSRMTGCWRDKNGHLVLRCTEVKYDGNDNVVRFRSGEAVNSHDPDAVVTFQYDERKLPYRAIAEAGSVNSLTNQVDYNPNGKIKRFNCELYVERMVFDGFDRIASFEDAMGNQTRFNFDANDNLKLIRHFGQTNDVPGTNGNIRLSEARYQYDGLDRLVTEQALHFDPASQAPVGDGSRSTTWNYAPNGQCISVTDDFGHSISNSFDTVGRLLYVADSSNNRLVFTYDALGNVLSAASHELSTLGGPEQVLSGTNVYDALSRCVSTTDNMGNTNRCFYDSRGLVVRAVDPLGNIGTCAYDGLGRATITMGDLNRDGILDLAVDASRTWSWDDNDRLTTEMDSHNNPTTYSYDSLDRCTLITVADGTHRSLIWSPRSNVAQETDPNGTVFVHTYDLNDRCISNSITPGPGVSTETTFETFQYDGLSRLTGETDNDCGGSFAYDSLDNCVSETLNGLTTSSTYDSLGNRLSLVYPGGRAFTYTYDAIYRCRSILQSGAAVASFDYDGPARVSRISYQNRINTRIFYDGTSGTANAPGDFGVGQVNRIRHALAGGSPIVSEVTLAWDRNGNKTSRADAIFAPAIPRTNDLALQYDGLDRMTRATVLAGTTLLRDTIYTLDNAGNRASVSGAPCSGPYTMEGTPAGPRDFQVNQYTTTGCDSRTYDENGNLAARSLPTGTALSYTYDCRNRLVSVNDSGAVVATYSYDALGRRIAKTVGGTVPTSTQFLYDGACVIEERSSGAVTRVFCSCDHLRVAADQKNAHGKYRDAVAKGVSKLAAFTATGALEYFFHSDDLGNVLALTGPTGNVVERYDYDDYGAVTFLTSDGVPTSATSSSVGNGYLFGGMRFDAETGLDCDDGGMYLEPQSGRYLLRAGVPVRFDASGSTYGGHNPWSDGGGSAANIVVGNTVGAAAVATASR